MAGSRSTHEHYYHLVAKDHRGLGQAWGECFGETLREEIAEQAEQHADWHAELRRCRATMAAARGFCPELIDEIEGMAEASGAEPAAAFRAVIADPNATPYEACTTVVSEDGQTIAHNEDWSPEAAQWLVLVRRTLPHSEWLELHYLPSLGGNAFSVHSLGHCQAINSLPNAATTQAADALPADLVARRLSESPDPRSDVNELRGRPRAGGYAHTILGPEGLLLVENSASGIRLAHQSLPFVHSNHRILKSGSAEEAEAQQSESSRRRYARAQELLTSDDGLQAADSLERTLADTHDGPSYGLCNRSTIARCVAELDPGGWTVKVQLMREVERGFLSYRVERS